jgi:hypothetical protein
MKSTTISPRLIQTACCTPESKLKIPVQKFTRATQNPRQKVAGGRRRVKQQQKVCQDEANLNSKLRFRLIKLSAREFISCHDLRDFVLVFAVWNASSAISMEERGVGEGRAGGYK